MKRSDIASLFLAIVSSACNTLTADSSAGAAIDSTSDGPVPEEPVETRTGDITPTAPVSPGIVTSKQTTRSPPSDTSIELTVDASFDNAEDTGELDTEETITGDETTAQSPTDFDAGHVDNGNVDTGEEFGALQLPPPDPCSNQFSVEGCVVGDPTSACEGRCSNDYGPTSKNACESGKEGMPVQYACPRHMLFSPEMENAVAQDGYTGVFHYAIVGHDPDLSGLDAGLPNSCCQCYQLVFGEPTYLTGSLLSSPPPLVVQSANTQASGPAGFDVFMGAGGFGVFNACDAQIPLGSNAGHSQYLSYPAVGQAFNGGVKPGPDSLACDENGNLNSELISAASCQEKIETACNQITAASSYLQETSRHSCIQSNQAEHYYHENWNVYARRVQCPDALTDVTGCKPDTDPQLPAPDPDVRTAAEAKAAGFLSETNGQRFHTTTMQDCCMPTCAWVNNVQIDTKDDYASFYSCTADGTPITRQ